jgi:hypothetical protein
LGRETLLRRDDEGHFEARPAADLRALFGKIYGEETDWASRIRSAKLVANALNKSDIARATMIAVLMRLPDPDGPSRGADVDGGLAKAGFNPDEPRDERGRWTDGGDAPNGRADITNRDPRVVLADAGLSDAGDDSVAQAAARAATDSTRHNSGRGNSHGKPAPTASTSRTSGCISRYRSLWAAIVAFFGNPQNTTRAAEDTHELASRILGSHLSKNRDSMTVFSRQQANLRDFAIRFLRDLPAKYGFGIDWNRPGSFFGFSHGFDDFKSVGGNPLGTSEAGRWGVLYLQSEPFFHRGYFRDVYPVNLLTTAHLNRETREDTVRDLVLGHKNWGQVTPLVDNWFMWCVPLHEIDKVRREFESRGLLEKI